MNKRVTIQGTNGRTVDHFVDNMKDFRRLVERSDKRASISVDGGPLQPRFHWLAPKHAPSFNGVSSTPSMDSAGGSAPEDRGQGPALPPPTPTSEASTSSNGHGRITEDGVQALRLALQAEREQRVNDLARQASDLQQQLDQLRGEVRDASGAIAGLPAELGSQQDAFRQQLDGLLRAELARIGGALKELRDELGGRPARSELGDLVAGAIAPAAARIDRAIADLREERDLVEEEGQEQLRRIRTYRPGVVEELQQRLRTQTEEIAEHRRELSAAHVRIDELERDSAHLKQTSGAFDREELQRQLERIAAERQQLEEHKALLVERDQLQRQVATYAKLEATYLTARAAQVRDEQLAEEARDLRRKLDERERTGQQQQDDLERTRLVSKEQQKELRDLRQRAQDLTAATERLKAEEQRLREEVTELRTAAEEHGQEKATLDEQRAKLGGWRRQQEELIAQRLREADEQLRAKMATQDAALAGQRHTLEAEYQQKRDSIEEKLRLALERDYRERLDAGEREVKALREERDRLRAELATLRSDEDRLRGEQARWEAERHSRELAVQRHESGVQDLERRRDRLREEIEEARRALTDEGAERERRGREQEREIAQRIEGQREKMERQRADLAGIEAKVAEARARIEVVDQQYRHELALIEKLHEERRRLEEPASREVRAAAIEIPIGSFKTDERPGQRQTALDEMEWLDGLDRRIRDAEFYFSRRLLEAFHTSLKITHWSPLTVLAGVSGTGKSALARLYAHFGGLRFLLVPVQPNWDSPQDLFGFFNHMDGRYKATSLLRALRQSQRGPDDGGFAGGLLLVALDEMNLAPIEYYGSELLSRWEARRDGAEPEALQIDLGEGEPYPIPLGGNVLWVGTMNEDETTRSLSDKVLERGNVITFPRPQILQRRQRSDMGRGAPWLDAATFSSWTEEPDKLPQPVRDRLKATLEGMNEQLGVVNRAISHRILQAIEYYVANHPRVRVAVDTDEPWRRAFADQLVQKVLPKLRGVDTHSKGGKRCLDEFEHLLGESAEELVADFQEARRADQFIWTSARYLEDQEVKP